MKTLLLPTLLLSLIQLSACSSSSDDYEPVFSDAYLQFYNGSSNSAATLMAEVDGNTLGTATYGDASGLITSQSGELELEFFRIDADDQQVILEEVTVDLSEGEKVLMILSCEYESPSFTTHRYIREELEAHFRLFATSVISGSEGYDLYMNAAGEPFSAAHLLGTINLQQFDELTYWDPDTDSDYFNEGEYILYLTTPGSNVPFFESATISFAFDTEYVLALRTTTGAIQDNVVIDLIINSSAVANYTDEDATAQYRVYNSLDDADSVSLTLAGNKGTTDDTILSANTLSDFSEVEFGDYRLSING
ncbi:hypothetical protein [Paraglaciecola sp. MB-3u-78]|uniref:hypothetical protein n=1 Tax=Paraglaciecola sp. MB-3u-78 TaxID=2058332 RepID=UPI001E3B72A7|nr:hypothetical protein [Paraglaciecola sp. MB-3u-78]